MGTPYRETIVVPDDAIDVLGHVNNAVWVQWMERVAVAHWDALAPSGDQDAYFWVITRHEIDYRGNARAGDVVTAETWVQDRPRGARFDRHMRFLSADGRPIVETKTTWAIVDRATQRILRVPEHLADLFLA